MDQKKANMPAPSRWENRQKALDKKKQLADRLQSAFTRKKADAPIAAPAAVPTPEPSNKAHDQADVAIPVVFGRAGVRLRHETDNAELQASRALAGLVDMALHAASTRERFVALQWPGSVSRLPLVHVLSTLERWADGDKRGLRCAFYPARANSYDHLNHLFLDRNDVLRWARELYEDPREPNPRVSRPLSDKDPFLFSLSSVTKNTEAEMHPTAGELIPRFSAGADFQAWPDASGRLLEHVAARVGRRYGRWLKRDQCATLGKPSNAPDSIFGMHYSMSSDDIAKALRAMHRLGPPDVVLVDATKSARRALGTSWAKRLGEFVAAVHRAFPTSRPGMVLVADEPQVAEHLKHVCIESCMRLDREVRQLSKASFAIHAVPCTVTGDGLLAAGATEPKAPKPLSIQVRATDADAARAVDALERYAAQCPGGRPQAKEAVEAAQFLHRLSVLPASVRHLINWLEEMEQGGANHHLRDKFTWIYYRGRLNQLIARVGRGQDPQSLERALKIADELWKNYQHRTAFAEQIASAVGVAATSPKHIAVVFDRPMRKRLAERFLTDYNEFPGGKRFSDFSDRVRLLLGSDLEAQLAEGWATRYVFAGADDKTLRTLVVDDRLPGEPLLLLTQRSARYLHGVLRRVLQYPAFSVFKPRVESMARQLSTFVALDDKVILQLGDMELPDFDFQAVLDANRSSGERPDEMYEVVLEGGRRIFRGLGSEVFLYDPIHANASDRGFRRVSVDQVQSGDRLFDMSPDLRERVEDVLKQAGVPIQRDKPFETKLRHYHQVVSKAAHAQFDGETLAAKARQLLERMVQENPTVKNWPKESAVRHWIDLGKNPSVAFEDLRPQAPLKREHFLAFSKALRLNELVAQVFLLEVILPIRNARRLDGRHVSDIYSRMLLDPESVMVHAGLKRSTIDDLFARAMDNVYSVEAVQAPRRSGDHP